MNKHVKGWLAAYYDGHLEPERAALVEAHLQNCPSCQAEFEGLQALSDLLHVIPGPDPLPSPQKALERVWKESESVARPLRKPAIRAAGTDPGTVQVQKSWWLVWMAAPFVLITGWAFWHAVLAVSSLGRLTGFGEIFFLALTPLLGRWSVVDLLFGLVSGALESVGVWIDAGAVALQVVLLHLTTLVLVGVLLWGWLASWWVFTRQKNRAGRVEG